MPVTNRQPGFTLVETLVALLLVSLAMLLGLSFFWQQPRILERLEARRRATRAIEAVLEGIRAKQVDLGLRYAGPTVIPPQILGDDLTLTLEVIEMKKPEHLFEVVVTAHYFVATAKKKLRREERTKTIRTLVWDPVRGGSAP